MLATLLGLSLILLAPNQQAARPESFIEFFNGAHASLEAGRLPEAEARLEAALALRPENPNCGYALACVRARAGDLEHASLWLSLASSWGYDDPAVAAWDPDLEPLRMTAGWTVLLGSIEARLRARPRQVSQPLFDWGFDSYKCELSPDKTRLLVGRGSPGYLYGLVEQELLSVLSRHGEKTLYAHFTPGGRYIVRSTSEAKFEVWDGRTGEFVREMDGPGYWQGEVLCSPDGTLVVGFGDGPTSDSGVRVWDLQSGKLIRSLPIARPTTVAVSPDAKRALAVQDSVHGQTSLGLWDLERGVKLASHEDCGRPMFDASFSSDGALAFALSAERGRVVVYDGRTGAQLHTIDDEGKRVSFSRFLEGQHTLVIETESGELRWVDAIDGAVKRTLEVGKNACALRSADPSGRSIFLSRSHDPWDNGARIEMLDARTGESLWQRDRPEDLSLIGGASFSVDGELLVLASDGGRCEIAEARTGKLVQVLGPPALGLSAQAGSDPESCLVATSEGVLHRIALATGRTVASAPSGGAWIRSLVASPDGQRLLIVRADGRAVILDSGSLEPSCELAVEAESTRRWGFGPRFSPDGEHLAIRCAADQLGTWSARTGKQELRLELKGAEISDFDWSHDSRYLVVGDGKGTVQVFENRTGAAFGPRIAHPAAVGVVRFSPRDERFVVCGANPIARVFEPGSDKPLFELSHADDDIFGGLEVCEVVFTPDGSRVVTTSLSDGGVDAWDAKDGHRLWKASCGGGNPEPLYARFDRTGTRLCMYGQTIQSPRVIDAETGATLLDFHDREYGWLDFSADGRRLLASKWDSLQVLQAADGALLQERVELGGGEALLRSASMHVEGTSTALRQVQVLFGGASYPLDGFAAVLLDPKRVRAAAAGIRVAPAILPQPPTLELGTPPAGSGSNPLVATGSCALGMLGFEVELDGQPIDPARVRAATRLEGEGRRARLELPLEVPAAGGESRVRVCAIGRSGVASRPAFAHLRGTGR